MLGDRGFHYHQREPASFGFKFPISVGAEQLSALSHSIHTLLQQSPWGRGSKCHLNKLGSTFLSCYLCRAEAAQLCALHPSPGCAPAPSPGCALEARTGQGFGCRTRMGSSAQRVPVPSCPVPSLAVAAPPCPPSAFHHLYYTLQPN